MAALSDRVVEVPEGMIGGTTPGDGLERLLDEHAREGRRLASITSGEVQRRLGPGGAEVLPVAVERTRG